MCAPGGTDARSAPAIRIHLADIFANYRDQLGYLDSPQVKAVQAIIDCRTAVLGGHARVCDECGHREISYNSCRNRHCPRCQSLDQARWIERQEADLLPVEYHHAVFTIPDTLHPLFQEHPRLAYDSLFAAVAETLQDTAAIPRLLGARLGFTAILHTWTQDLRYHPHLHVVVVGGGLDGQGHWHSCRPGFFLPVDVLRQFFQAKLLRRLEITFATGTDEEKVRDLLIAAAAKTWVVFTKPAGTGATHVLGYLGRYIQRTAFSSSRLLDASNGKVTFTYRDRADGNKKKTMSLPAAEFLHRYLLHVLPTGFMRVRHYGFLGNACRATRIAHIRDQLEQRPHELTPKPSPDEPWEALMLRITGRDVTRCPACKQGKLQLIATLLPTARIYILQKARSP